MKDEELRSRELLEESNFEERDDVQVPGDLRGVISFTRDWTVDTIVKLLSDGDILLNPKFQRRKAWSDEKRSALIESLIWGAPIPQIILAEIPNKPRKYVVIDGKQRLSAIHGFIDTTTGNWDKPRLGPLRVLSELKDKTFADLKDSAEEYARRLLNADVRCTILSNYQSESVLAEIFYRINTGSVLLGAQELRQVLRRGWFADFLVEVTNTPQPIHDILNLNEPDVRLNDVEIILRALSMNQFGSSYRGNLKDFLDSSMDRFTREYSRTDMELEYEKFNSGIVKLKQVLATQEIGRRRKEGQFDTRFNRALFEVEHYFISKVPEDVIQNRRLEIRNQLEAELDTNQVLIKATESTTKSMDRTRDRFREFARIVLETTGIEIEHPFK